MKRIDFYNGIYGERGSTPEAGYILSELLETRSQCFNWDIKPHTHPGLYQLFFVETGSFDFFESGRQQKLSGCCLLLIPPTELHGFRYDPGTKGRILTLSEKLVETLFGELVFLAPMLRKICLLTDFPAPYTSTYINESIINLDRELFDDQPEKQAMLKTYLQQLFIVVYRLWQCKNAVPSDIGQESVNYFRQFKQLIRKADSNQTIKQIAVKLGISAVHLNRICREIAGKSAGHLIEEHLLEEAEKYLIYTSYSISEIAYLLNFEYPNYFARFFKKHTGLTPSQFREKK